MNDLSIYQDHTAGSMAKRGSGFWGGTVSGIQRLHQNISAPSSDPQEELTN
jgi:hypothetical protein